MYSQTIEYNFAEKLRLFSTMLTISDILKSFMLSNGNDCIGCCVYFCPCIEMCKVASALDESCQCCLCCGPCLTCACSPCLPSLRTKTRVMTGVKVDYVIVPLI